LLPAQVFTLLEGIYAEFDRIAARRRVFKVETVGDCYVAVFFKVETMGDCNNNNASTTRPL
jgi:class 3 adenylate cyclase